MESEAWSSYFLKTNPRKISSSIQEPFSMEAKNKAKIIYI